MAIVGIDRVFLGINDDQDNVVTDTEKGFETGLIEVTNQMKGTNSVNFQVTKNGEEVDGNNQQVDYIRGMDTASMDVSFNNLPFDVQNKILGRVKQGSGVIDSTDNTYVTIIAKSHTLDGKDIYIAMPKCVVSSKGANLQTSTGKKVNWTKDDFSFEGLASDRIGSATNIRALADEGFDEAKFFSEIYPGQTLVSSSASKG